MPQQPASSGYGPLARNMADWTTKGLFAALVLTGGLGFGRQIIRWWHQDDAAVGAPRELPAAFDSSDASAPVDIAVGNVPLRLQRQTVMGDQAAALEALRAACRRYLPTALAWSPRADEDERRLLARLADMPAQQQQAASHDDPVSDCQLYEPVPGMPLVVGTRRMPPDSWRGRLANNVAGQAPAPQNSEQRQMAREPTAPHTRVVLWGLASPAAQDRWTISLFAGSGRGSDGAMDDAWPLPPNCQRLMSLGTGGAEISAFQGGADCDQCRLFFNQWQAEHRPDEPLRWQPTEGGGWYASLPLESRRSLVIQLVPGRFAGTSGLVLVVPDW